MEKDKYDNIMRAADKAGALLQNLKCEYAAVRLSEGSTSSINLAGKDVDSISSGNSMAGSVRVLCDGAWGFVSFNDLSDMERRIKEAFEAASSLRVKEKSVVKPGNPSSGSFATQCGIPAENISLDEKFTLLKSYNDILMSSDAVQTTRAVYRDAVSKYIYLDSFGSRLEWDKSFCGVALSSVAKDGGIIQPYGDSAAGYGGFEIAGGLEETAERVVRTAVDMLSAKEAEGGKFDVITDPKLSGVFIHEAFGHMSEADFVYENPRMLELMKIGSVFGPEELNVYDDGSIPEFTGYIPFDDEGNASQKNDLVVKGTLTGRLHSRETSAKMNEPLTGNARAIGVMRQPIVRMTNTYIDNGPHSREELFEAVEDGLYMVDSLGGQTNLEMFTFSPACAYIIKNGKIGPMVRNTVLSGNLFQTLKNISMIANDKKHFGGLGGCGKGGQGPLPVSLGGPHMLIKNVLVGGRG